MPWSPGNKISCYGRIYEGETVRIHDARNKGRLTSNYHSAVVTISFTDLFGFTLE